MADDPLIRSIRERRRVPEHFSLRGSQGRDAQKAWLDGFDCATALLRSGSTPQPERKTMRICSVAGCYNLDVVAPNDGTWPTCSQWRPLCQAHIDAESAQVRQMLQANDKAGLARYLAKESVGRREAVASSQPPEPKE